MLMARTTADGALDSTFGQNGIAPLAAPASSIALQADGKILAISGAFGDIGATPLEPLDQFGLAPVASTIVRYNENGALDTSFGTLSRTASIVGISGALLTSNGDIVAVGSIINKSLVAVSPALTFETAFALARYNSNGGVDNTFGSEGGTLTSFGSAPLALPTSAVIESNGSIIAAGEVGSSSPIAGTATSFALARYTSAGVLDSTFGFRGTVLTPITPSSGTSAAGIAAVALDAAGRLVAVGNVSQAPTTMVVARYLTK